MNKFLKYSLNLIIAFVLVCSIAYGGARLNFDIHETEFIQGHCKLTNKDFSRKGITLWTCEFTDGCLAGWVSDISGANQRNFRWINKRKHGKIA